MKMRLNRHLLLGASLAFLASCKTTETDRDFFLKADVNKDGQLSLDEINKAGLPRLFDRFDVNGDGMVTLPETRKVEPGFDEKLFNERDANKDGKVTYEEYSKIALSKGGLKKPFAEVDLNGDGVINKSEAEAYTARRDKQDGIQN